MKLEIQIESQTQFGIASILWKQCMCLYTFEQDSICMCAYILVHKAWLYSCAIAYILYMHMHLHMCENRHRAS